MREPITTAVRMTAKRKKALVDFLNAYNRVGFHENSDRKIRPFESAKENHAPVLVDGVIFHELWQVTDEEMGFSDPEGAWQVVIQQRYREITCRDPLRATLSVVYDEDAYSSFKIRRGEKSDGTPYILTVYIWVRADDQSAAFTKLTKWLSDKALWLKILSA